MKLKLQELLKRFPFIKYRYKIKTTKDNFKSKNYFGFDIKIENDDICFFCNRLTKEMKKDTSLDVEDIIKNRIKIFLKGKTITSCSVIFILGIFILSNLFIREIKFSNNEFYDYCVLEDVNNEVKRFGPFKVLDQNLNDLSNKLREKYYHYAYIGVRKKAGVLYIDIEKIDVLEKEEQDENKPCDIISCVDGKVIGFEVVKGIPVVSVNQIIKKGDLLITGNINYQSDPNNLSNLVHSEGIVLLEYACYEEVKIPKSFKYDIVKNEIKKDINIYLFNRLVGKNRKDEINTYTKRTNIFLIEKVLRVDFDTTFETQTKSKDISIDEAKILAEQKLFTNFFNNKISPKEEIKMLKLINVKEDDSFYYFYYLIKGVQNKTIKTYY